MAAKKWSVGLKLRPTMMIRDICKGPHLQKGFYRIYPHSKNLVGMDNIFTRFAATVKTLIRLNEINEKESGRGPKVLTASKLMKLFSKENCCSSANAFN